TKYPADSGEILVNESYMLTPGSMEVQRFSFGMGEAYSNIVSLHFAFDYTDYEGVVHHCVSTQPAYLRPGLPGFDGGDEYDDPRYYDPDPNLFDADFFGEDEYYHRIDSIIGALGSFEDQFGNVVSISNDDDMSSLDRDTFLRGVENAKNTITVYFAGDTLGYNVSPLRAVKVQCQDKQINENTSSTELVEGTMGGVIANPTEIAISNNPNNYYDLEANHQMFPDIAMDAVGNFVVTWTSYGDSKYGDSSTESNIYARRFDSDGDTISVGLVNTGNLAGTQKWSSVDMDRQGDFVISWTSDNQENYEIYAKRYTFLKAYYEGEAPASDYDPNREADNAYYTEAYTCNENGFLVDFKGKPIFFHSGETSGATIVENYADIEYKAMGDCFVVNTTQLGKQEYSKVSMDANGNFIVAWESDDKTFNEADKEYTIYAQKFVNIANLTASNSAGKSGNEMTLPHFDSEDGHSDRFPSVAMNSDGDWIVAWTCFPGQTDDASKIYHVIHHEKPY
ncbi:MAG: hypothetical protein IKS45_02555, partial [Thermoguttaceae bacterium]|nr:hypothetical protein [Thermoguttaceae bacterium]